VRAGLLRSLGTIFSVIVIVGLLAGVAGFIAWGKRPIPVKLPGLGALEVRENQDRLTLLDDITYRGEPKTVEPEPPLPGTPRPADTRLYNNLLDNLLSGLHYYYSVPEGTPPSTFVTSWDADSGGRILSDARLFSLEVNVSYLLALEMYSRLHAKAVFDEDLERTRKRVSDIFAEEWHTTNQWPLGPYFDLVALSKITGEEKYLQWADRYGAGTGPEDPNTPLTMAKSQAVRFQRNAARSASPFHFYYAALLAEWGSRHDPALIDTSRFLFDGLKDMLYDDRFKMLFKQVAVGEGGSTNITMTFDALEQLSAVRAIVEYERASGDRDSLGLAKTVLNGVWQAGSPLLRPAPEQFPENTFFGLYTAYDHAREAERFKPIEVTIVHILLYDTVVLLNEETQGEFRGDVDFLASWLETSGPAYREDANGYYTEYDEQWNDPKEKWVSSKASIWMARALVTDEWYRFHKAQAYTSNIAGQ